MKPLTEVAENYFNTLNPIAEKISADIVAIKDAYEDLWNCLSIKEKNQIINETVVHPEAILKYTLSTKSCEGGSFDFPLINRPAAGTKYIVDENTGLTWKDEHSGPFSWKTPSQINLCLFPTSKDEIDAMNTELQMNHKNDGNKNKENHVLESSRISTTYSTPIKEELNGKKIDKNDVKKKGSAPLSAHNVVLVGTCSKLTGFCSKFKFLPTKSYTYEVQTVVSNPSNDSSFLDKLKSTTVCKIQNILRPVGAKTAAEKKATDGKEAETLVQTKGTATVVRLTKPSPKIAKPKSPPPPPPAVKASPKSTDKEGNFILIRNSKTEFKEDKDSEKATLLGDSSVQSFLSADPDSLEQDIENKVSHELSDDFNSISTEYTPLSGLGSEVIPKSGFDFLDNW